jgi:hypothetical protein
LATAFSFTVNDTPVVPGSVFNFQNAHHRFLGTGHLKASSNTQ